MKLDDQQVEAIVSAEITDAVQFIEDELSPQRAWATRYYNGELPDVEADEGRSQMVSRDVHDVVHAMLPSIVDIFFSSDRVVEYVPTGPEDEQLADQATDYANYVLQQENDGFTAIYAVIKDALIRKCGFVKVWHHEAEETTTHNYSGIDQDTAAMLAMEPNATVSDVVLDEMGFVSLKLTRKVMKKSIKIAEVPPEELIAARRDRYLGESFVGHRRLMTVSDLVAMGYDRDEVMTHVTEEDFTNAEEWIARTNYVQYEQGNSGANEAMRRVLYVEAYCYVDRNGDGIAEMLKVCTMGNGYKVVAVEECNYHPFVAFPCDPEPHLSPLEARSKADDLMDLQRLKSVVLRNTLDSLAQAINPRMVVVDGQVEMDDVLNNEVGAVIRARRDGALTPILTPDTSASGLRMLDYVDMIKESRTGISKASMGLDPDALQGTTVKAANEMMSLSQGQMKLTARILANGLRDLFKLLLRVMTEHQDQPKMIRLRNRWVQIDPRTFNPNMDVSINIALGNGTTSDKVATLSAVAQKQEQILSTLGPNNPIVTLQQYSATLAKLVELGGFKNTGAFVNQLPADYQLPPPPPPGPDPQMQAAEMLAQVEREKAQAKMQIDAAKLQADQQVQEAKLMLERDKFQAEMARKQLELEMQEQKILAELRLKEAEAVLKQLTQLQGSNQNEANQADEDAQQEANEARQEGLLAQATMALGQMIAQSQAQTAAALSAPKRVIRDQAGKVVGVAPVITEAQNDSIPPAL